MSRAVRRPAAGFSLVEALVGAALAGVALAGLAGTARLATHALRLARHTGTAVALAGERLEALRATPAADGADERAAEGGTSRFQRSWRSTGGRGRPRWLSVRVAWESAPVGLHAVELATEALP
jgi:Tfp pilus assembly protein PilV